MSGHSYFDLHYFRMPPPNVTTVVQEEVDPEFKAVIQEQIPNDTTHSFPIPCNIEQSSSDVTASLVHSQISRISLFQEKAILNDNKYQPSSDNTVSKLQSLKAISFDHLLTESESEKLMILVGAAGSGKTTCSLRLAKKFNEVQSNVCFRLEFKLINYDEKLSYKDLLSNYFDGAFTENNKDKVFEWIRKHPNQVLWIIDGYDQFEKKVEKIPPKYKLAHQQPIEDLIAALCSGNLLPGCRFILTSRSHSLDSLPNELKNKAATYLLHGLSKKDMLTLLRILAKHRYPEVLTALKTKAPHLKVICRNPLLLKMNVAACLSENPNDITSMTRIFKKVVDNLRVSKCLRGKRITEEVLAILCQVAYTAIQQGSVLISKELLKALGSSTEEVQGFIFIVPGTDEQENLVDGKHKLFFSHQALQEYFAARYIFKQMPLDEFEKFIEYNLYNENWLMVAQFLCGMVVDPKNQDKRRELIICKLINKMEEVKNLLQIFEHHGVHNVHIDYAPPDFLNLCALVRECNDKNVSEKVAKSLPTSICVTTNTPSESHAVGCLVRSGEQFAQIELFSDSESVIPFLNEIKEMQGKIKILRLIKNKSDASGKEKVFLTAVDVLSNVTEELMMYWFKDESKDFFIRMINKFQDHLNT